MKLLVDGGNTRVKWQLRSPQQVVASGYGQIDSSDLFAELASHADSITAIVVSTVMSEAYRVQLQSRLAALTQIPIRFHWAEASRGGLVNAYAEPAKMGADRWHAMYGAWARCRTGFVVVDAGSALTVDYVDGDGHHLGGYILPGQAMMLNSLRRDAARIGFDASEGADSSPGVSTTECVHHGLSWLRASLVASIQEGCGRYGIRELLVTGGDAERFLVHGLPAVHCPDLVLDGLALIDHEDGGV